MTMPNTGNFSTPTSCVSEDYKRRTQPFSVRYFRSRENARDEALGKKLAFCQI